MSETCYNAHLQSQRQEKVGQMKEPEEVSAIVRLHQLGWGAKRIARELGMSRNTVKRYVRSGGWSPYSVPQRKRSLEGLEEWLKERFFLHRGNADVVRQELKAEHGVEVSLRTVERACEPLRQALRAEAKATVRFETGPGEQMQIDFGTRTVEIGGEKVKVKVFVATLGYSRRLYVRAFEHERQAAWFEGMEGAFRHFGGVPQKVLLDNASALVQTHDSRTREVQFNERLLAFARYWGFSPRACAPFRARTKGKDERGVGYVKSNALAGRSFASWAKLESHLTHWMRDVADVRVHGTTGEAPIKRFEQEAGTLAPLNGRPPFAPIRELKRRVANDACVEVDTNHYSVPWRLIRCDVTVLVEDERVQVHHAGQEVAAHVLCAGKRQWIIDPEHLRGIVGAAQAAPAKHEQHPQAPRPAPELLRPLSVYAEVAGGDWQ